MLKKKILVSLLTAVVTLSMLAGCGNKQENAGSNSDSTGSTNTSGSTQESTDVETEEAVSADEEVSLTFGFLEMIRKLK